MVMTGGWFMKSFYPHYIDSTIFYVKLDITGLKYVESTLVIVSMVVAGQLWIAARMAFITAVHVQLQSSKHLLHP